MTDDLAKDAAVNLGLLLAKVKTAFERGEYDRAATQLHSAQSLVGRFRNRRDAKEYASGG
jgi:hypothetical protein